LYNEEVRNPHSSPNINKTTMWAGRVVCMRETSVYKSIIVKSELRPFGRPRRR